MGIILTAFNGQTYFNQEIQLYNNLHSINDWEVKKET